MRKLIRGFGSVLIMLLLIVVNAPGWSVASNPGDETLETIGSNPVPPRDPVDLAIRFRGLDPADMDIAPRPPYQVGDVETFITGGTTGTDLSPKEMVLVAATDRVYLWFERGIDYNPSTVQEIAEIISKQVFPTIRSIFGEEVDIEGDPHIYILNVSSAGEGIAGLFNDTDRFPDEVLPSSNEINSLIMTISTNTESYYLSVVAHEFQHLVQADLDDSEETWFIEGFAELGSLLALPQYFETANQEMYINDFTGNQLNAWAEGAASLPYYGAASLFLAYITQQYGDGWVSIVATEPADGVLGIDRALARYGAVDPLSGDVVTFDDVFADFVIANFLNDTSVSDGRFGYTLVNLSARALPTLSFATFPVDLSGSTVNQYGTTYIALNSQTQQTLTFDFQGHDTVPAIPAQAQSGSYFYWAQNGNQGDARLTGRFDLSGVNSAMLNFKTWYEIEEAWDYGYISISTDGGATWHVLTTPDMTAENPYDRAFAEGFTGNSGGGEAHPAPYIGFAFGDGLTVGQIQPDSPAQASGLQSGDVLVAINGEILTLSNFFPVIDQYAPGQEITLSVTRNGEPLDLAITLGAHPNRTVAPEVNWQQESIDLTPYVGGEVLIRFDYVTDQATTYSGWLLDDIEIPEIGFSDDIESANPVWTSEGWVRIDNTIPQDYLVQVIEYNGDDVRVQRILEPGGGSVVTWTATVGSGQRVVLAISGIAPITRQPAAYDLTITPAP